MNKLEKEASIFCQSLGVPVLISSNWLRELGAGQIDLAFLDKSLILVEVKNSFRISKIQKQRIYKSALVLSGLFDLQVRMSLYNGEIGELIWF